MDPGMHSATSNIVFAVQDQPIADLSAHAPVLSPHLCEFQLPGRPRRKNEKDQKVELEELLKAMFRILLEVPAILSSSQSHAHSLGSSCCLGGLAEGAEETRR